MIINLISFANCMYLVQPKNYGTSPKDERDHASKLKIRGEEILHKFI